MTMSMDGLFDESTKEDTGHKGAVVVQLLPDFVL